MVLSAVLGPQEGSVLQQPSCRQTPASPILPRAPAPEPRAAEGEQPSGPPKTRPGSGGGPGALLLLERTPLQMVLCWRGAAGGEGDPSWEAVDQENPIMCAIDRD